MMIHDSGKEHVLRYILFLEKKHMDFTTKWTILDMVTQFYHDIIYLTEGGFKKQSDWRCILVLGRAHG